MVTITVTPVNDPPIAVADTAEVDEGHTLSVEASALLANDTDAEDDTLRITAVGNAVNGTVSLAGTTITYTHDGSETTTGSFSYTVSDGTDTDMTVVTIAVTAGGRCARCGRREGHSHHSDACGSGNGESDTWVCAHTCYVADHNPGGFRATSRR